MSLSSEHDLLHPYLLRDVLEDAIKQMEVLLQKYKGDGFDDMYCRGYRDGVEFSKDKLDEMWEEFKGKMWSDNLDEIALEQAKVEYEALEKEVNQ